MEATEREGKTYYPAASARRCPRTCSVPAAELGDLEEHTMSAHQERQRLERE